MTTTLPTKDGEALPQISCHQWPSQGWFALYTSSRREKHVARLLDERRIEHFLPLYRADRHWKKRSPVTLELPLFPNYVFVRAGQKASLLSVPGVLSIVGTDRQPWPLPDHEIEALRSAVDVCKLEPHSLFAVGERVRIKKGALAGMQGVLIRKKSNLRVVLTVEVIKSSVSAEVDQIDLEPIDDSSLHSCRVPLQRANAS
jgi:transcription termination/antitermination protein NusG